MIERWIRGPWWDCCWILSGPAIGAVLIICRPPMLWLLGVYLVLNSGHLLAPVAMAWGHRQFRLVMLASKGWFVFLPVAIVVFGGLAGAMVTKTFPVDPMTLSTKVSDLSDYAYPIVAMMPVYFAWNAYHFAMQNYGLLRLYRPRDDRAVAMQWAMFGTLFGLIIIPIAFHQPLATLFCLGAVMVNHQLAAIGLSSHVWANYRDRNPLWFAGGLIAAGTILAWAILSVPAQAIMTIVGLRIAAGFVHFLYDRWVYKFSDPQVRATIGADLFRARA